MCNSFLENGEVATKDDCNDDADDSSKKLCLYLFSLMSVSRQYSQYIYIYIYIYNIRQYTSAPLRAAVARCSAANPA